MRLAGGLACLWSFASGAQTVSSDMTSADAFLPTGSPNYQNGADLRDLNFGGAGTLAIASANALKGEVQSVIRFNLSNSVAMFNTNYGTGHWTITAISLELTSNYGTAGVQPNNPIFNLVQGGQFVIEWMADDDWIEGTGTPNLPTTDGVTFNSLPGLLAEPHIPLCTNLYKPPGDNVHVTWPLPLESHLVADVAAGGDVSFHFYAADNQVSYLFNSCKYGRGNEPLIHITVTELLKWLSGSWTNGGFNLTGLGSPGTNYQVQACSDLSKTNWQTVGSVPADGQGLIHFFDSGALTNTRRFYRLAR